MARFNTPVTTKTRTTNLAGGDAFVQEPKFKFASLLLTSFVQDQYYRSADDTLKKLVKLIDKISDKKFPAKAAIYARQEYGMRSITHAVAGELAKIIKGEEWTKRFFYKVVRRPDDITEILSYYLNKYKKPLPNALKKGLASAFDKFDEYQLAKYRGEAHAISLVDAVNLLHPTPVEKNESALKKLIADTLRSTETWESKISAAGKVGEEKKEKAKEEAWKELILEKKIGYFALLRNLRNILEQAPAIVENAANLLIDKNMIEKSLVLPFRYLTAINEIEGLSGVDTSDVRKILVALNQAVDVSLSNVPKLKGTTLVALDESGSMMGKPHEIGGLFAAILVKTNNADLVLFSDDARYININPLDSTLTIAKKITSDPVGSGTNFHPIFTESNKAYDRFIILSDMQGWMGNDDWGYGAPTKAFTDYKARTGANPNVFSFDLQGYGSLQFPRANVYEIAGFSDKVFDVIKLLETDRQALITEIEKIEL